MIRSAVARGWLEGPGPELRLRRSRLVKALFVLIEDPGVSALHVIQFARNFLAMDGKNLIRGAVSVSIALPLIDRANPSLVTRNDFSPSNERSR